MISRVYKNDLSSVEIRKTENEKTAGKLMKDHYKPDIVIASDKISPSTFAKAFTLYPLTKSGFDQNKLCFEMQDALYARGEKVEGYEP